MNEFTLITWKDITGNKLARNLHPAMLSDGKYHQQVPLKRVGDPHKTIFSVEYDKEYVLRWVAKKVCEPLNTLGKEEIVQLVKEAYDLTQTAMYF